MPEENRPVNLFRNPIVILTMLLVLSVVALIGAAVIGVDKGVLINMSTPEYARGLITYLFAVVTIGTAVVLVLSALIGTADEAHDKQFQRGKEVLSLLLGVFGTIVGFYFGSAHSAGAGSLQVSRIDMSPLSVVVGDTVTVRAFVVGGTAPYKFGVYQGDAKIDPAETLLESGVIVKQVAIRQPQNGEQPVMHLIVEDASGKKGEQEARFEIRPKP